MSKTATDKKAVPSNPNAVEFARDEYGITQTLKREGLRAAGRVNGDEGKLRTLIHALDTLREHSIARYKAQVQIKKETAKATEHRNKVYAEEAEKQRKKKMQTLETELLRLGSLDPKKVEG